MLATFLLAQILTQELQVIYTTSIPDPTTHAVAQGQTLVLTLNARDCAQPINFNDTTYHCRPDYRVIIGVPMAMPLGVYPVTSSTRIVAQLDITPTQWQREHRKSTGRGAPIDARRLALDRIAKNTAFSAHLDERWNSYHVRAPLSLPIDSQFRITDPYGLQRLTGSQKESAGHNGVDLAAPEGQKWHRSAPNAISMASGVVVYSGRLWLEGNTVIVYHGDTLYTSYCHLRSRAVRRGDLVRSGHVVGVIGSTGNSSGPHLHLTFRINGVNVDPLLAHATLNEELR